MTLQPGQILNNRYRIEKLLGQGGMATVFMGFDTLLERQVAIKLIRKGAFSPEVLSKVLKRFEREVKTLARLSHLHIINIFDYGNYQGSPFLVMEHLQGGTLKDRVGTPMDPQEAARLLLPIAGALAHSHNEGIVHRDIKPSNILIDKNGAPQLADFGIARILDIGDTTALTLTGMGIGTPEYMSPEQGLGEGADPRSDVYALGVVFYEMITGCKPFEGDTPMKVINQHINAPLRKPSEMIPGISKGVESAILKAMEKEPDDRYQGMDSFIQDLKAIAQKLEIPETVVSPPIQETSEVEETRDDFDFGVGGTVPVVQTVDAEKGQQRVRVPRWGWYLVLGIVIVGFIAGWILNNREEGLPVEVTQIPEAVAGIATETRAATDTIKPTNTDKIEPTETSTPTSPTTQTSTPTSIPRPTKDPRSTIISPTDGMSMSYIPGGSFEMGSEAVNSEKPIHSVFLDAYYFDQTEVTNSMFASFVNETGYVTDAEKRGDSYVAYGGMTTSGADWQHPNGPESNLDELGDYPVVHISWNDAVAYCNWAGRRLPTEAEWEKAARGGLERKLYPWGSETPVCTPNAPNGAQFLTCGKEPKPIKSFSPNGYGIYDVVGNVREWVSDWYSVDYFAQSANVNPEGPTSGDKHVVRGSSWTSVLSEVRVASRSAYVPDGSSNGIGFRCALSINNEEPQALTETKIPVPTPASTSGLPITTTASFPGRLAFVSGDHDSREVFILDSFGSDPLNLSNNPHDDHSMAWSPDGKLVAFVSERDGDMEIFTVTDQGEELTQITDNDWDDFDPAWSPGGDRIAFASNQAGYPDLYLMKPDDPNPIQITDKSDGDSNPIWLPSWTQIAFIRKKLNADTDCIKITHITGTPWYTCETLTTTKTTDKPYWDEFYLFTLDLEKFIPRQWTTDNTASNLVAAPQDNVILKYGNEIIKMEGLGSNRIRFTKDNFDEHDPALSPAGTQIAFVTNRDGREEIYLVDLNGENLHRITNNQASDSYISPSWSPDGQKIAFIAGQDGIYDIWVIEIDGTNLVNVSNNPGNYSELLWLP
jgi:serine/threonine protein kinase/Tol biopolymer transport system component